jgi:hypothetical protein
MRTSCSLPVIVGFIFLALSGCQTTPRSTADAGALPAQKSGLDEITPDAGNLRAYVALARTDIRLQKSLIIAQNLPLTEDEAAGFWPIHRDYEEDLATIDHRRFTLIKQYFGDHASFIDDATARQLARDAFALESDRTALKREYFDRFQTAVPAAKAARFFQLENQLNMVLDLRVASALPLIK